MTIKIEAARRILAAKGLTFEEAVDWFTQVTGVAPKLKSRVWKEANFTVPCGREKISFTVNQHESNVSIDGASSAGAWHAESIAEFKKQLAKSAKQLESGDKGFPDQKNLLLKMSK